MPGRYKGADIAMAIFAGLVALGSLLPWGDPDGGPFDEPQAIFTLVLGVASLAIVLAVPKAAVRKWAVFVIALVIPVLVGFAIHSINSADTLKDPITFLRGKTTQAGVWVTMLASICLWISSIALRTKPRDWGPGPALVPQGALGTAYDQQEAKPEEGWIRADVAGTIRRLRCPRCSTIINWYGTEVPACPKCSYQGPTPRG